MILGPVLLLSLSTAQAEVGTHADAAVATTEAAPTKVAPKPRKGTTTAGPRKGTTTARTVKAPTASKKTAGRKGGKGKFMSRLRDKALARPPAVPKVSERIEPVSTATASPSAIDRGAGARVGSLARRSPPSATAAS